MIAEVLARRYAKALLNSLPGPGDYASSLSELKKLDILINTNKPLRDALFHPTLPKTKKADIFRAIFEKLMPSPKVGAFCLTIIDHGRIIMFSEIVKAVEREWERRQRIIEVEIRSAVPLKSTQRARLEAELSRITAAKLKPIYKLDDSLVAGVVTRIGTTFYDGSLKSQLRLMRESLLNS